MEGYKHTGPIDCDVDFDASNLKGKTAVVTGGANGIGEAYVRALVAVGVYVCIGDLDVAGGEKLRAEFPGKIHFVRCDVSNWDDQVKLFKASAEFAPDGRISHVVANAGIIRRDEVFAFDGKDQGPQKPELSTIDINIKGSLYTSKLAMHSFIKQNGTMPSPAQEDTCLVLIGSRRCVLGLSAHPTVRSYEMGRKGMMHALRRTAYWYGSRVNVIMPWYVKTKILTEAQFKEVSDVGVEFATTEDAGQCLLRILSDRTVNGHSLFLSARKWAKRGYLDLDIDDYAGNELIQDMQADQMRHSPAEKGLFV